MTSNIGDRKFIQNNNIGFAHINNSNNIRQNLKKKFTDEFINRIDEIILFKHLEVSALKEIAKIKISDILERTTSIGLSLEIDDNIYDLIAYEAEKEQGFGARPLNRLVVSKIEKPLADMIVKRSADFPLSARICVLNNDIVITENRPALKGV